jgi:ferric-dicitrate binding protein FerR (iron transport regulator)
MAADPERLEAWIDGYLHGTLSAEARAALDREVATDPVAARTLLEAVADESILRELLGGAERLRVAPPEPVAPADPPPALRRSRARLRAVPRPGRAVPVAAAAALLLGLGFLYYIATRPAPPPPQAPGPAPVVARAPESPEPVPAIAGLVDAGPGVRFVRGGIEAPAGRRLDLQSGDRLRVPDGVSASIRFTDGSRLGAGPGSDLALEGGAGAAKRVTLAAGALVADILRQPESLPMVFVTPQAEVTVLGTSLTLAVEPNATRLDVTAGTVRLAQPAAGRSVEVGAGQCVVAAPGAPPVVRWRADDAQPPEPPERPDGPASDYDAAPALEVRLGETVPRTWEQVRAAGYAWGPRQANDARTGETVVWLPYGRDLSRYARVRGMALYDPRPGTPAKAHSRGAHADAELTLQLRFDRPVGAFRFDDNWSEVHVGPGGEAGAEYSVDGRTWVTMRALRGEDDGAPGIHEPFAGPFTASGLDTRRLLVRYYARAPRGAAAPGPGRWLQIWMAGDPGWGDVATTFFERQLQVRVAPKR